MEEIKALGAKWVLTRIWADRKRMAVLKRDGIMMAKGKVIRDLTLSKDRIKTMFPIQIKGMKNTR